MDSSTTNLETTPQPGERAAPIKRRFSRRALGGLAALVIGGALSVSVAQAHGFGGGEGGFLAMRMHKMLDKVGATDSQRAQIKAIWEGLRPQLKAFSLQTEPWLFTINRQGVITARLEGAFGLNGATQALEAALK